MLDWSEPDAVLRPLNTDVSTLAFTLWLGYALAFPGMDLNAYGPR